MKCTAIYLIRMPVGILIALLMSLSAAFGNNITISSTSYATATNKITFTITWDNSWKVSSGAANNDAVWIFIKRQPCGANGIWSHALLSTTAADHAVTGTPLLLMVEAVTDGMGVFLRRSNVGIGSVTSHTVTLKLSGTYNPSLTESSADNFKVYGVEMVYVSTAAFYIGDGRAGNTSSFSAGNTVNPLQITSAIQSSGLGNYANYTTSPQYACGGSLPASFPLGYNSFYCMKYEISQGQYVEFLNTLTYDQQAAKLIFTAGRYPNVTNQFLDPGNGNYRNTTRTLTAGTSNNIPAVFTSTYPFLPQSNLNWQDLTCYLDWAGLRPMSEFEFEKVCRGDQPVVANEYPWGNKSITDVGSWASPNTTTETATSAGEGLSNYSWGNNGSIGAFRSGFPATQFTNRSTAGAAYYGAMEMGGNLYEQCVGGGSGYNYSTFTNANGDGVLTIAGKANVVGWPPDGGLNSGTILRGGSLLSNSQGVAEIQTSDRSKQGGSTFNNSSNRLYYVGGRGVRSF